MGWSLSYLTPAEPELLGKFFLIIGKSLYLATSFESKCQFVHRVLRLSAHCENTDDINEFITLMQSMKDSMLGQTIKGMEAFPKFITADNISKLERAKDARNYIAHESTEIGVLSSVSAKTIDESLTRLRRELAYLIVGDDLVSRWVFEIEEKQRTSRKMRAAYHQQVFQWVFGSEN